MQAGKLRRPQAKASHQRAIPTFPHRLDIVMAHVGRVADECRAPCPRPRGVTEVASDDLHPVGHASGEQRLPKQDQHDFVTFHAHHTGRRKTSCGCNGESTGTRAGIDERVERARSRYSIKHLLDQPLRGQRHALLATPLRRHLGTRGLIRRDEPCHRRGSPVEEVAGQRELNGFHGVHAQSNGRRIAQMADLSSDSGADIGGAPDLVGRDAARHTAAACGACSAPGQAGAASNSSCRAAISCDFRWGRSCRSSMRWGLSK